MRPQRKEVCDCGLLQRASREPAHPVRFDSAMNEYFIGAGNQRLLNIYYCPFCGGRTPESRRELLFEFITSGEEFRICGLFREIRTERDVRDRFGPPDREEDIGSISSL